MKHFLGVGFFAAAVGLNAQVPAPADLTRLNNELREAIRADDLTIAAHIALRLDDGVQKRFRFSLTRDAGERVDEVLTWLPVDTESLMVHQQAFTITKDSPEMLIESRPSQVSSIDRLSKINEGKFYRALQGRTIRLVVAGMANIRSRERGISPALSPNGDGAWFYFFAEPLPQDCFGAAEELIENRPAWRGTAMILTGERRPGASQPMREDESWLALARPDLLVMASSRALLAQIVTRILDGSQQRALPPTLPEWAHVNRSAPFWGLRHYSDAGGRAEAPDPTAVGLTVQFDPDRQQVEITYLSSTAQLPRTFDVLATPLFHAERPRAGVWRLTATATGRGPYVMLVAIGLLGFGGYR